MMKNRSGASSSNWVRYSSEWMVLPMALHSLRTVASAQTADQVVALVEAAIAKGGVLALTDQRGRRVVVPVGSLGYVEIGQEEQRRVGFGAL